MAMVIAAVIIILTGCLSIEEAHESIDWRTVFLVAGMLPLGMAMEATGTAQYLANIILGALGDYGAIALLAGMYLLAALITQAMSNAAAMVLIVPIAVEYGPGPGGQPPHVHDGCGHRCGHQLPDARWA
jgi:di/tricarboxylate transporter